MRTLTRLSSETGARTFLAREGLRSRARANFLANGIAIPAGNLVFRSTQFRALFVIV